MLSISQAAKKTGLSVKSIRHYEEIGLITAPPRNENGYAITLQPCSNNYTLLKVAKMRGSA